MGKKCGGGGERGKFNTQPRWFVQIRSRSPKSGQSPITCPFLLTSKLVRARYQWPAQSTKGRRWSKGKQPSSHRRIS